MGSVIETIIQTYGIAGLILVMLCGLVYMIYKEYKSSHNIDLQFKSLEQILGGKLDNNERKIDLVEQKLTVRINELENKSANVKQIDIKEAKVQSSDMMSGRKGGKLAEVLRGACTRIGCDHIFLGSFHNGTTDLSGVHYCKFDILTDEFKDPLHLRKNDIEFSPMYKDANIIAYGDLPFRMLHLGTYNFEVDEPELLELSDTLYRRCKGRDIKQIAFSMVKDEEGYPIGFVGCVSYIKKKMYINELENCAKEVERITISK